VDSPTFLGGLRTRTGGGLVDPAALCWGLKAAAVRRGVRIYEGTEVVAMRNHGDVVQVATPHGRIDARGVVLATNAYPPLLRSIRNYVLPIYDHVLVSEPLTADALASIGWNENQGVTDVGNQFHYYRRTPDDRILWGGYDAIYYYANKTDAQREQRDQSHQLLARQFFQTFPQLTGLRFTHRWAGLIDSTSRFTPVFGTAMQGRVSYAVGFTGLGVAASRFGARVALDLLANLSTERTQLTMVRRKPVPFPPEPVRYPLVQATRAALAREDARGERGMYLRLLDRFGVGFNS
jgi:glycine/D-amino acid oxidase-like deaminating enzyme